MASLTAEQAEMLASSTHFLGEMGRQMYLAFAGVSPIEEVIDSAKSTMTLVRMTSELLSIEDSVRRRMGIVGPIDEFERGLRACGVDLGQIPQVLPAVLEVVGVVPRSEAGPENEIRQLINSGISWSTFVYVICQMINSDLFDHVDNELHEFLQDIFEDERKQLTALGN
jgi:hypothetical protein